MSVIDTINNEYHFWEWILDAKKRDSSYGNCFSLEGAKAVQAYFDELSEDTGQTIEFDPIAWCCEFSEYASLPEFNAEYNSANPFDSWEQVAENTTVIELDNGAAIVGEF